MKCLVSDSLDSRYCFSASFPKPYGSFSCGALQLSDGWALLFTFIIIFPNQI
jgi:hypothetical protein